MSKELYSKIEWTCTFQKKDFKILGGHLRIVKHTNLAYVEPHRVIIDNKLYLFFNDQTYFYSGNLEKKIPLSELSNYRARHEEF